MPSCLRCSSAILEMIFWMLARASTAAKGCWGWRTNSLAQGKTSSGTTRAELALPMFPTMVSTIGNNDCISNIIAEHLRSTKGSAPSLSSLRKTTSISYPTRRQKPWRQDRISDRLDNLVRTHSAASLGRSDHLSVASYLEIEWCV